MVKMKAVHVQKPLGKFSQVPIELLHSPKRRSREIFEDIHILAKTIKEHGLLEPLVVRQDENSNGFQIICGERRLRAAKEAQLKTVPCIVMNGDLSEEQILEFQLIENLQRQDLKPFEELRLLRALKDRQLTNEEIAAKVGVSSSTIGDWVLVGENLPEEITKQIVKTKGGYAHPKCFTISKAILLARSGLPIDKIRDLVRLIHQIGYTQRQLAQKLAKTPKQKIKRVVASRTFWKELTKSLKEYARYWNDFATLKEWETVSEYHLTLEVVLPKDLGGLNTNE